MKSAATILNFNHVYELQTGFRGTNFEWFDFTDIRNTNGYCDLAVLAAIHQRLRQRKQSAVAFFGTGNYHYITYLFLSEIKVPFTLVLFDYHTDLNESAYTSVISCGAWVATSLKRLPLLQRVVLIGVNPAYAQTIPQLYRSKVRVFPATEVTWTESEVKKTILSAIPTRSVYISIDKDVLRPSDALTDWDQGDMKLEELLHLVWYIALHKYVCGFDIGGEYPVSFGSNFRQCLQAAKLNEKANRLLLAVILRSKGYDSAPLISA